MVSLKNKMQMIIEESDRYKSLYEQAEAELKEEKKQRSQVCQSIYKVGVVCVIIQSTPNLLRTLWYVALHFLYMSQQSVGKWKLR